MALQYVTGCSGSLDIGKVVSIPGMIKLCPGLENNYTYKYYLGVVVFLRVFTGVTKFSKNKNNYLNNFRTAVLYSVHIFYTCVPLNTYFQLNYWIDFDFFNPIKVL